MSCVPRWRTTCDPNNASDTVLAMRPERWGTKRGGRGHAAMGPIWPILTARSVRGRIQCHSGYKSRLGTARIKRGMELRGIGPGTAAASLTVGFVGCAGAHEARSRPSLSSSTSVKRKRCVPFFFPTVCFLFELRPFLSATVGFEYVRARREFCSAVLVTPFPPRSLRSSNG